MKIEINDSRKMALILVGMLILACVPIILYSLFGRASSISEMEAAGDLPVLDRSSNLLGPDKNSNGIRDDIDAVIEMSAKKHNWSENKVKALQFAAKTEQDILSVDLGDPASVQKAAKKNLFSIFCMMDLMGMDETKYPDFEKLTFNTKERLMQYLKYSRALSGHVIHAPNGGSCG